MNRNQTIALLVGSLFAVPAMAGGWVDFVDETTQRLGIPANSPSLTTTDSEEKDYAWGDVDMDGDIDVVVVRKQPFTSTGKRTNVLLMNEGVADGQAIDGVFVDRTTQFATASDVGGDQGFNTPTNDRDVQLVDLTGDGLLDIITATTLSDGDALHLKNPRVYVNLGFNGDGSWRGFRYESARIPEMEAGPAAPRFCSVSAGDVDGDGDQDLYFGDYDSGGGQIIDFNNRLLINNGSGFFTDESLTRMGKIHNYSSGGPDNYLKAAFGAASIIVDMNNDGRADVVKQTSLNAPTHIAIVYNNINNSEGADGFFSDYDELYNVAPYFVSAGHLNDDGILDLVITDDGTDRYLLSTGIGGDGQVNFSQNTMPSATGGFGGNSWIADLNNDGFNDIIQTDVDVDIAGCSRRMQIYRNSGGSNPSFTEEGQVIPFADSDGTHDVAVFDINGDGWLDMIVGRCNTTEVYMNNPPIGLTFLYPNGRPVFIEPSTTTTFDIELNAIGGSTVEPGSGQLFVSIDGGPFNPAVTVDQGGNMYEAQIPGVDCAEDVRYYVEAELVGGGTFTDPAGAPASFYTAIAAEGQELAFRDEFEGAVDTWTIQNDGSLSSGAWEQAEPVTELFGGVTSAPGADSTQGAANVLAFVTQNGDGTSAGANDIDGGPTYLISPTIDLSGTDGTVSFDRWFASLSPGGTHIPDFLEVEISNDNGANWVPVPAMTTGGTNAQWETASFVVGDYVTPTSEIRVRFIASDSPNNSITEAGIDDFQVESLVCNEDPTPACPADSAPDNGDGTFGNGVVNIDDLLDVINRFGEAGGPADSSPDNGDGTFGNGIVNIDDLLNVINSFGACPA
ncbi:MAG: FG-GAP-like repeat-containing protein [Planctomycetota bacterium]